MKGENRMSGRSQTVKGLKSQATEIPSGDSEVVYSHPDLLTITASLHLEMSYIYGATYPSTGAWL